jgi:hypothetical protein
LQPPSSNLGGTEGYVKPGDKVSRYEWTNGAAMARAFAARLSMFKRRIALKMLKREVCHVAGFRDDARSSAVPLSGDVRVGIEEEMQRRASGAIGRSLSRSAADPLSEKVIHWLPRARNRSMKDCGRSSSRSAITARSVSACCRPAARPCGGSSGSSAVHARQYGRAAW